MFCGECGSKNSDTDKFCSRCGAPLEEEAPNIDSQNEIPVTPAEPPEKQASVVFCGECGSKNSDADKFCSRCGAPLEEEAPNIDSQKSAVATVQSKEQEKASGKKRSTDMLIAASAICLAVVCVIATVFCIRLIDTETDRERKDVSSSQDTEEAGVSETQDTEEADVSETQDTEEADVSETQDIEEADVSETQDTEEEEQPVYYLVSMTEYDETGVRYSTGYEYDAAGNCIRETIHNSDGSIGWWFEYGYDAAGNQVSGTHYYTDGIQIYEGPGFFGNTYDAAGNLIERYEMEFEWEYTYDAAGNLIRYTEEGCDERTWGEYTYDAAGNRIKGTWYSSYCPGSDDDEEITSGWNEYIYDAAGNLIKYMSYNSDGSISSYWVSEYDAAGSEIKRTFYAPDGSISSYWVSEYDAAGNLIKCIHYNHDGSIVRRYGYQYEIR